MARSTTKRPRYMEDAEKRPLDRVAVWRAQNQERPWECLELREHEEAVPLLKVKVLRKGTAIYKSLTGVDVDVFHPKVPVDLPNECSKKNLVFSIWWRWRASGQAVLVLLPSFFFREVLLVTGLLSYLLP